MDWLKGMNDVVSHIEENLHRPIEYETLSRIVGCSVYEFFRIFSFMTGMSLAEYIRRRRLSQAVFDICSSREKIIDIALKYGYESPTSFAKAFKGLHGISPSAAREAGAALKTYPPISFKLTIQGVEEMNFRLEKRDSFAILGIGKYMDAADMVDFTLPSKWLVKPEMSGGLSFVVHEEPEIDASGKEWTVVTVRGNGSITLPSAPTGGYKFVNPDTNCWSTMWGMSEQGEVYYYQEEEGGSMGMTMDNGGQGVSAYDFFPKEGRINKMEGCIVDERKHSASKSIRKIPASDWAMFTFSNPLTPENVSHAYVRILTEWFPASGRKRNENMPHIEVVPLGKGHETRPWEIWIPVLKD